MQTYQVQFPADIPHEVIAQTLRYIGGAIVADAAPAVRKVTRKASKLDAEFPPVIARHKETGEVIREIDGITAQKMIAKMDGARKRAHAMVHRVYPDFPAMVHRLRNADHVNPAHEYMQVFCQDLHHVKAQYTNGVTA